VFRIEISIFALLRDKRRKEKRRKINHKRKRGMVVLLRFGRKCTGIKITISKTELVKRQANFEFY
jgi:hypothetical protein